MIDARFSSVHCKIPCTESKPRVTDPVDVTDLDPERDHTAEREGKDLHPGDYQFIFVCNVYIAVSIILILRYIS